MAHWSDPWDFYPVSPLIAAANLIGVITSNAALADARKSFHIWQGTALRCMLYQMQANHGHGEKHDDEDAYR